MAGTDDLNRLGALLREAEVNGALARNQSNIARPTYGEITDVADPEERGRVKLILDEVNPEYQSEQGYKNDGQPTVTAWMEPSSFLWSSTRGTSREKGSRRAKTR